MDDEAQKTYEEEHIEAVMLMLRIAHIRPHKNKIKEARETIQSLEKEGNTAENYVKIRNLMAEIEKEEEKINAFRPFFGEPYYARRD